MLMKDRKKQYYTYGQEDDSKLPSGHIDPESSGIDPEVAEIMREDMKRGSKGNR